MANFTTNLTFSSLGQLESSEFGTISIAGKRGSTLSFNPTDNRLIGDASTNGNLADVMAYDLTLFSTNALRFSNVNRFELGAGADVLDLGVRGANAGSPYTLNVNGRGGTGNDLMVGGNGNDTFVGEATLRITLIGGSDDRIFGAIGNDTIYGDFQNVSPAAAQVLTLGGDDLRGGDGGDSIYGDAGGTNLLTASVLTAGDDQIAGGDGGDLLVGDTASTTGIGVGALNFGDDTLSGGLGTDTIYGDSNDSLASVLGGNDIINGGAGNDQLYGDTGAAIGLSLSADTFAFGPGSGADTINDFQTGEVGPVDSGGDVIDLSAYNTNFASLTLSRANGVDTLVGGAALGGDTILVENTWTPPVVTGNGSTQLDSSEFDFA